ncbi:MAG: DUF3152 domain-containing protein [Acidimicrobiales bacterium]
MSGITFKLGLLTAVLLASCADDPAAPLERSVAPTTRSTSVPALPPVEIAIRLERRTSDEATVRFEDVVRATLTDARGWQQAGFRLSFAHDAPFVVVLAEAADVDTLCEPYDTFGLYSCQIGPVVALNADRWRTATPEWTGDVDTYRQMFVNHEVGHLLGQHHPAVQCPAPGEAAPVMAQQSTELDGCLPNPWPLAWEIACAARHAEPLAPPYEPSSTSTCGP